VSIYYRRKIDDCQCDAEKIQGQIASSALKQAGGLSQDEMFMMSRFGKKKAPEQGENHLFPAVVLGLF
jgi:hypothetical protein